MIPNNLRVEHNNIIWKTYYSHVWAVIHLAALNFHEIFSDRNEYITFYNSLSTTLGCVKCISHYRQFMVDNPPDFTDLFGWTVKLHNSVNESRGETVFTREESFEYWTKHIPGMSNVNSSDDSIYSI